MLKFDASSAAENIFKPQALAACAPPSCSEKEVLSSVWGGNVAKNYFFSFLLHSRIRSFWMSYMLRREEKESRRERVAAVAPPLSRSPSPLPSLLSRTIVPFVMHSCFLGKNPILGAEFDVSA